jgi:hypothetical protein
MDAGAWMTGSQAACLLAALIVTLALAAWLTPRRWWRRPNLRALSVVGGGTLAFGALFAALSGTVSGAAAVSGTVPPPALAAIPRAEANPAAGAVYRVVDELNLRSERGVRGRRLAVLPAGTTVTATGITQGDWWQVRASAGGRELEGWASSLWLRRDDEGPRPPPP